ncbi:hypothetical protein EPA93_00455 [Ktedonosporobacter rubrisoli]|uniref:Uncharacterized protein n=1 Tax=Ktedonosporobacter rubrisoli TaxID=2509675 RepID=A0A4P6JHX6_KTERU|nr:hypothetical protein [Ktedonosporobacter rubrisoli]QBD74543.1 hypothetical protein EPA93_00455 [Ktedonosporobacter rubrisoli]
MNIARSICAYIIWIWLGSSLLHGVAHLVAGAPLTPLPPDLTWLGLTIELFFSLAPLVALVLLYTRRIRWGAALLCLSMLIALLWGFGAHFMSSTGDNVMAHATSPAGPAFLITSVLIFIVPWAGLIIGIHIFRLASRQLSERNLGLVPELRTEKDLRHAQAHNSF